MISKKKTDCDRFGNVKAALCVVTNGVISAQSSLVVSAHNEWWRHGVARYLQKEKQKQVGDYWEFSLALNYLLFSQRSMCDVGMFYYPKFWRND